MARGPGASPPAESPVHMGTHSMTSEAPGPDAGCRHDQVPTAPPTVPSVPMTTGRTSHHLSTRDQPKKAWSSRLWITTKKGQIPDGLIRNRLQDRYQWEKTNKEQKDVCRLFPTPQMAATCPRDVRGQHGDEKAGGLERRVVCLRTGRPGVR